MRKRDPRRDTDGGGRVRGRLSWLVAFAAIAGAASLLVVETRVTDAVSDPPTTRPAEREPDQFNAAGMPNDAPMTRHAVESTRSIPEPPIPGTLRTDERTALAREFDTATDYHAFVTNHADRAIAGNGEASYLIYRAYEYCWGFARTRIRFNQRIQTRDEALMEATISSALYADEIDDGFDRCERFLDFQLKGLAVAAELEAQYREWLDLAAKQGHPAATLRQIAGTRPHWSRTDRADEFIEQIAAAVTTRRPDALRGGARYFDMYAGIAILLMACERGDPCSLTHGPLADVCKFRIEPCVPGEDFAEHLRRNAKPYDYEAMLEAYERLQTATQDDFAVLLREGAGTRHEE